MKDQGINLFSHDNNRFFYLISTHIAFEGESIAKMYIVIGPITKQ